jgi:hypothetical protein
MNFDYYVAGKTIAVVGPAPLPYDQSEEIEAHDIVYRVCHHLLGGWYGTRTDMAYLNGQMGREILDPKRTYQREIIDPAEWWVYKSKRRTYRPEGLQRVAIPPDNVKNVNAITGMLWDLTHFHPKSITVYGADLYASGPGDAYYDGYDRRDIAGQAQGIIMHRPWEQMRAHRAIHATGMIVGDDRYLAAVTMPDEQYQAVIDSWQQALEPLT